MTISGRFLFAAILVLIGAGANLLLPDGLQSALVALIAGIAAILVMGLLDDRDTADDPVDEVDEALQAGP